MLTAFFNTFVKQARLWEMQCAVPQEAVERAMGTAPKEAAFSAQTVRFPQTKDENRPAGLAIGSQSLASQRLL